MTSVRKVTVSLPAELLACIEERRRESGANRSAMVTDLLWRGWRQLENEDREERYQVAYHAQTGTAGELQWADIAANELLGADTPTESDSHPGPNRRAAR